ncbi:uncharacterized protein [Haliotis cracherodii]|uniref:uncharacterized protein n=1 Tax=Haliotis cracherodii TaxID=6455 RepID=UPI0039E86F07
MSYLTLLLCLVLLNSIEKSGHVIGHLISCGDPTWQSADVVEDTGVMMLVSHSLMPNDVELIPSLDYEVHVSSTRSDVRLQGFFLSVLTHSDNTSAISSWPSPSNSSCPYNTTDYNLPITLEWTSPITIDSCITLRLEVFYNASAKQILSTTLCKPTGCLQFLIKDAGRVTSPLFPSMYPDDANCSIYIIVDKGDTIDLQFQYMDLESPYSSKCFDMIEVYGNNATRGPFCGKWTRERLKELRFLATNFLKIRFVSDNKLNSDGFQAVYQTTKLKVCNQTLYNLSGAVSSPFYPQLYFPNVNCVIRIVLPSKYRIRVKVIDLDLEHGINKDCVYDKLQIYDSRLNRTGKTWCGSTEGYSQSDLRYESSASDITIEFKSDHVNEFKGFNLTYLGVPSCHNETFNTSNGSVSSVNFPSYYPNGQECYYTIKVDEPTENIELTFEMFYTESDDDARKRNHLCNKDYIEVFDGKVKHRVCGNWHGQEHLLMFRSFGSTLVFKFVSDEQTTKPGFYAKWRTVDNKGGIPCVSTWLDTGNTCFEIIYQRQTWFESDIDCRSRGGHLATIADLATEVLLSDHLENSNCTKPDDAFWIGASDQVYESDFYWTDGSKVKFSNWFQGWPHFGYANRQPSDDGLSNEDCVELRTTFNYPHKGRGSDRKFWWNDRICNVKNPYVCQCYRNGETPPPKKTPDDCDNTLVLSSEDKNTLVTSPGYPGNYSNFLDCRIVVSAPHGYSLVLEFDDFDLEESEGCRYDYLTLSPFPWNSTLAENTTRLCGNWTTKPKLLRKVIPGNILFLHFSTDHSFRRPGFNATISLMKGTDRCEDGHWGLTETACVKGSTHAVSITEAEVACSSNEQSRLLLGAGFLGFFLVAAKLSRDNDSESHVFWYDVQNDSCQALRVNQSLMYGNIFVPSEVVVENVSCNDTLPYVCYKNITGLHHTEEPRAVTSRLGTLSNTGYADYGYRDDLKQRWHFQSDLNFRILITLMNIGLEYQENCLYDFLEFKQTIPEGRYCGTSDVPRHLLSTDNQADVTFETDYSVTGSGFLLSWMWLDMKDCTEKTLTEEYGNISSFNFPFAFPDAMNCQIVIQGVPGNRVFLELEYLNLPVGPGNYLEVLIAQNASLRVGNSSSVSLPLRLVSSSANMTLFLKSASVPANCGFRGTYKQLQPPFTVPTNTVKIEPDQKTSLTSLNTPLAYPPDVRESTIFRAPVGHMLTLKFTSLNLEPSKNCHTDYIRLSDVSLGKSSTRVLTTVCRDNINSTNITSAAVVSIYNRLELYFVSGNEFTTPNRGYSAVVEAIEDPEYLNKTSSLKDATFDSCIEQPCVNGGKCQQISGNEAKCKCPGYYTGLFCQVTHCELSPCVHGQCVLTTNSYACGCIGGFWGPRCDKDAQGCRKTFCGGQGECIGNITNTPQCDCDDFWEGSQCGKPLENSKMTVAIGQRLLGEPIWIGLIVILSVLLAFGIFYVIRRKCGKHFTCCDIKVKKKEKIDAKFPPSETPTPLVSFSELKARRCTIPPPIKTPPVIAITKAEDACTSTPGYNERSGDVAARFFASYKEAERTPIAAPVAVDFNKTTATSMASDSDDNSIVGGLFGGTLAFAGTRLRNEEVRRSEANKMLRTTSFLQAPPPVGRDRMKRSHSTGPFLVRQASLYDDMAVSQRSLFSADTSNEHLFPTVIVSNEDNCNVEVDDNSSIQIYLDETEGDETLEGAVGPYRQLSKSAGSVIELPYKPKVSSWISVAIDNCHSHSELSRKEKAKHFSRSASLNLLEEQSARSCKSRSKSEVNSFESTISCDCSRCRQRALPTETHLGRSREPNRRHRPDSDSVAQMCSCEGDKQSSKSRHSKRRHHRSYRMIHSCGSLGHSGCSSRSVTRASSTESEQYHKKAYASHKRSKANSKRTSKRDMLNVLDTKHSSDKDSDYARRELFRKFFSQEVEYSSEVNVPTDQGNVFRFPDVPKPPETEDGNPTPTERGNSEATCNVIIYNCSARNSSRHVNVNRNDIAEKSVSQEEEYVPSKYENENSDSAICSSEATTSSDSFKSNKDEKKVLGPSSSLLTVTTDTDSALSSAPKSFQASPYHDVRPSSSSETQTTFIHDMKVKDSAYQTKQSSVDVIGPFERPEEVKRKLSLPTTKSEESNVTQRLHLAAYKLFILQQRVRRSRFSKDSAVHTISEDEFHYNNVEDETGTDLFPHRRLKRGQMLPLRHLDCDGDVGIDVRRLGVQLKSTATPVSDVDQGSEVGEINV